MGAIGIVALAIAVTPLGQQGRYEAGLIAVLAFINVLIYVLWVPRQIRRRVAEAMRVNSGSEGQPSPPPQGRLRVA
jgi:cyanate permease